MDIELRLTVDEVNVVLEALGQQPFARVFELISKIQQQAQGQLEGDSVGPGGVDD